MHLSLKTLFVPSRPSGFSLIELSIVLVILGLLVGGVLGGKSLIRASQLRTVATQRSEFSAAAHTFRDKYFYLPGDMPNASQVWGLLAVSLCGITPSENGAEIPTCDGDGHLALLGNQSYEMYRFWQHLSNAGLIPGRWAGVNARPVPSGKVANSSWVIWDYGPVAAATTASSVYMFDGDYTNALILHGSRNLPFMSRPSVMPNEDLWNIDAKIDDGKPGSGRVRVIAATNLTTCTDAANSTDSATANYTFTSTANNCSLIFTGQW